MHWLTGRDRPYESIWTCGVEHPASREVCGQVCGNLFNRKSFAHE